MAIKFHTLAAIAVLIVSGAWVATGTFSSVGSATREANPNVKTAADDTKKVAPPPSAAAALRTVAFVKPAFVDHNRKIRVSGITQADKRVTLAVRTSGIIASLKVEQGDKIEKDGLVLSLDAEDKVAMVTTAKAILAQRQTEFDATSQLVLRGSSAKMQEDTARSALATAKSQLQQAMAEIDRLQVKAPFSGVIDRVDVEQGSYAQSGAPVAVLLQLDPIVAKGEINERDLAHLTEGASAIIHLITGQTVTGQIRHISREASGQTRTFPVEVEIPNSDRKIPAGMTAEIELQAETVPAVVLPRSVVTLSAEGELGIRILKADDTADFVAIDVIDDTPAGLVLAGVPANARIVVAGQDLVAKGDKVNAIEADPATIAKFASQKP